MLSKYNAKLTGAKGGGSDSDRNPLRPSAAPGYNAFLFFVQTVLI